ncbi:sel1 repeat family protein [Streptomyces sp. NPDC102365]|uniref:sel1 repeat family protein n=1 Tax=Streptomyces sp. NPDC102365 TaxID=3366162 RepID=UPI003810E46B
MTGKQISRQEEEFRADLRRLGDLYRAHVAAKFTQNRLARATKVSSTTAGKWLAGAGFPQQVEKLVNLVKLLAAELAAAGANVPSADRRLLDAAVWRSRHTAVSHLRAESVGAGVRGAHGRAAVAADKARARLADLPDKPRPFTVWSPQQLGVHPAIHGETVTVPHHAFVLPDYVEREHDRQLRERLETAKAGDQAVLIVVRGESCTGKTRTAYEAVRARLADWDLVFPKGVDSLLALLAADAVTPETVLWLNDAHDFFQGTEGEAAAEALRRRLEDPGPAVIVATMWPTAHRALTTAPQDGVDAQGMYGHARALLGPVAPVDVPPSFTELELRALRTHRHPSLETAARTSPTGAISQTLAAAPQLVDHYESAVAPDGPYGKAIITAAMDARRFGLTSPVTEAFLETAASGYLTERQRADADPGTWFASALRYARTRVMEVTAALEAVVHLSGMGSLPGVYRLADYLDHHARTTRQYVFPPASFWSAIEHHAATTELMGIGSAAEEHGRRRIAVALYRRAAGAGEGAAAGRLANLHSLAGEAGHAVQAVALYQEAAAAGHSWAWRALVRLEVEAGSPEGAEALLRQAVAAGDVQALHDLVEALERSGERDEAEALARGAAADRHTGILVNLANVRRALGDPPGAEVLFRAAGDAGDGWALEKLAMMRKSAEDPESAEALLRESAAVGHAEALYALMDLRQEHGDHEGARVLLLEAAEAGSTTALWDLAMEREEAGDHAEAERLAREAGALGASDPLQELAVLREAAGEHELAELLAREAYSAGDTSTLLDLALLREKANDLEGAERLAREATAGGHPYALQTLAQARAEAGDREGAHRLAWEAVRAGEPDVLRSLMDDQIEYGDHSGAEQSALKAANCGYHWALTELSLFRARAGDSTGAEQIRRFGLEADGSVCPGY